MSSDGQARPPLGLRRSLSPAHHPPRPHSSAATPQEQRQRQPQQIRHAPVEESRWTRIPEAYRPRDWDRSVFAPLDKPLPSVPPSSIDNTTASSSASTYDHQTRFVASSASIAERQSPPRRRARPDQFLNTSWSPADTLAANASMVQASSYSYDPPMTSRSAPEDFQRASRHSDPSSFARRPSSVYSEMTPSSALLPRSPAYPSATPSRKMQNTGGVDPAFQDEEEFRLFVDATTGLGPLPTFRQGSVSAAALSPVDQYNMGSRTLNQPRAASSVEIPQQTSPINESSSTTQAYQNFPDIPTTNQPGSARLNRSREGRPPQSRRQQQQYQQEGNENNDEDDDEERLPIDISDSGLGGFPSTTGVQPRASAWLDTETPMPDDELPDYATSQAEAHAAQRFAATRRAQELQRRWQQGGRKYGSEY